MFLFVIINKRQVRLNNNPFWNLTAIVIIAVLGFFVCYFVLHFLNKLTMNLSAKFYVGKTQIQTNLVPKDEQNNKGNFVQYNDELNYFFDVTKVRYVIFEDLDRYNTPMIFQRLRSLNKRLNWGRNRPIVFIYTLKDSIFANKSSHLEQLNLLDSNEEYNENYAAEQKAKFFDYIIPVFPLHSFENSRDEFVKQFQNYKYDINDFDKSIFYEMGKYIHDKREIINISSEFDMYFKKLGLKDLKKEVSV